MPDSGQRLHVLISTSQPPPRASFIVINHIKVCVRSCVSIPDMLGWPGTTEAECLRPHCPDSSVSTYPLSVLLRRNQSRIKWLTQRKAEVCKA